MRLRAFGHGLRAAALGVLLLSARAQAQPSRDAVPAEARKQAARKFVEGTRAFDARDFTRAGEAFAAAYELAPHPDALWNGARAWHKAGELARAANLYARYLRDAPLDAPDRPGALAAQSQLASKLARIEIHAGEGVTDVRVDGALVDAPSVFVVPGMHTLRAQGPRGAIEQDTSLEAGSAVSVVLEAAPEPAPPPRDPTPPPAPVILVAPAAAADVAPARRPGWSPVVVLVEAGVLAAVAGVTLWSGLDTLSTLRTFEAHPTEDTLHSGRSDEARTNVLIGVSGGLAALTALTAIFVVDWSGHGGGRVGFGLGPGLGTARISGSF